MRASATFLLHRWPAVILAAALLPLALGCTKDNPKPVTPVVPPVVPPPAATINNVHLEFQHNGPGNTTPLRLNTPYATATGQPYQLDVLLYYVSNIKLIRADGSRWAEHYSYHLVRVAGAPADNPVMVLDSVPLGTFTAIEFSLGVDSAANHRLDNTGDLSPNLGLQWNWYSGYIFWKMEGDYLPAGAAAAGLTYHVGRDPQYRTVRLALPTAATVTDSIAPQMHLFVDVNGFFQNLDLADPTQRDVQSGNGTATRVADNMATLFRVEHVHNEKK